MTAIDSTPSHGSSGVSRRFGATPRHGLVLHRGVTLRHGVGDDEWDEYLIGSGAEMTQTAVWGRIRASSGFKAYRIAVADQRGIVAGAQILVREIRAVGALAYVPYGPVVSDRATDSEIRAVADALVDTAHALCVRALFVQPPGPDQRISSAFSCVGFTVSPGDVAPRVSVRLDISPDGLEHMLGRMDRSRRRSLRRAAENPHVQTRIGTRADLGALIRLHTDTARRQRFVPLPSGYITTMYDELQRIGAAMLTVVEVGGSLSCARLSSVFGTTCTARVSGFDKEQFGGISPPTIDDWFLAHEAASRGCTVLNLGGLSAPVASRIVGGEPVQHVDMSGSDRFKMGAGGDLTIHGEPFEWFSGRTLARGVKAARASAGLRSIVNRGEAAMRRGL